MSVRGADLRGCPLQVRSQRRRRAAVDVDGRRLCQWWAVWGCDQWRALESGAVTCPGDSSSGQRRCRCGKGAGGEP